MEMLDFIKSRRSNRKYLSKAVEEEKISAVIEAGCYAPSGGNNQSWHFVVIEDKNVLDQLAKTAEQEFAKMEYDENTYSSIVSSINQSKKGGYVFHYNAPVLVVVANKKGYGNAMADSACAVENMMLMANSLDLGTCWINQIHWLDDNPEMRKHLNAIGIGDDETVCASMSLGYVDSADGMPVRKALKRKNIKITRV